MIELKNVSYKSTDPSRPFYILKDINLTIDKGSFVCIVGKNGSGKTTLGKLIKGLIMPDSGEVCINGTPNSGVSDSVGYIFTNPENQIVLPIVEDDIAFGLENLLFAEVEIEDKIVEALKDVDMEDYIKAQIHWLSKGEQQKIVAAGVIAMDNDIIVFDEATAMLDGVSRSEFMKIVYKLNKADKKTIILITHNIEDAMYADKVLLLDNGHVAFYDTKKEFFNNEELKKEYEFDFPDIVNLVNFYNRKGYYLDADYNNIPVIAKKIYSVVKDKLH